MPVCLVRRFLLFLVRIVSLLSCPLQIFDVLGTEGCSRPEWSILYVDNLSIDDTVS